MPATVFAGLDLNDTALRVAVWDATSRRPRLTDAVNSVAPQMFDVGFRESRADGRRRLEPVFPPPPDWQPDTDALLFRAVRHNLPALRDSVGSNEAVQQAVVLPALQYLRRQIGGGTASASIAVPFEYTSEHCEALERAARSAGFSTARSVAEPIAALLAYVPAWRETRASWEALAVGRSIWVVESGYWDLFLALVHLRQRQTTSGHRLEFTVLAGDCILNFGAMGQARDEALLERELRQSTARMMDAAFKPPWAAGNNLAPSGDRATWIVGSGQSAAIDHAIRTVGALLPGSTWIGDQPPSDVVAAGAAVHAAIAGEQLPYRMTIERRAVLGLNVRGAHGSTFEPIARGWDAVPASFERAFVVPLDTTNAPIEITFAAALPGGARCASLHTFVLAQTAISEPDRVVLVDGRLETAAGGQVGVLDGRTGKRLAQAEFRLA